MIKMINRITGTEMWVDEPRLNEYLALGHRLYEDKKPEPKKEEPKPVIKTTRKKKV